LRKKKREEVNNMLQEKGYDQMDDDSDYKYLVRMPMDSVTEENVEKLLKEKGNKEMELERIKSTTIQQMWLGELENLKDLYLEYKDARARLMAGITIKKSSAKLSVKKTSSSVKKNIVIVSEE
jgi:DNA topoisomerase-2